jgi:hypothetical protein
MASIQGEEIQIAGWYVVRSRIGKIFVLQCGVGSHVPEIVDGPFAFRPEASEAASKVWRP